MGRFVSKVLFVLAAGTPLVGCSDRVSDQLDFDAQLRLACEEACEVITACDAANPHYGSVPSCIDGCLGWEPITKPNQCASRFFVAAECTSKLSCEEYLEWVDRNDVLRPDGTYPEGIPCEPEYDSLSSCSKDKPFEGGTP